MLVDVPIRVQTPPNWLAKDRGINTRDGAIRRVFARMTVTGIRMATVAVLIIKAERRATAKAEHNNQSPFPLAGKPVEMPGQPFDETRPRQSRTQYEHSSNRRRGRAGKSVQSLVRFNKL